MSDYPSRAAQATAAPPPRSGVAPGSPSEDTGKTARSENGASTSPLRTAEAFETYCSQVQNRLAEHATQRASFLQSAYDRLTRLLHTARAVEDTGLYNELWQHRVAVRELLEALSHVSSLSSSSSPSAPSSANGTAFPASAYPDPSECRSLRSRAFRLPVSPNRAFPQLAVWAARRNRTHLRLPLRQPRIPCCP